MPALEDKQVIELNQNVKRVVRILETATGNTATIKAKKDDEKKLAKKKEDNLMREEKLIQKQEDEAEKTKVRFFDVTTFIRSSAKEYFDKTETNLVTWGGLFQSMSKGVSDWFNEAKQQNTMLGRTLRFGASLWKATGEHIVGTIKNVFGKIGSQMQEVLGEVGEALGVIKDAIMSVFRFIGDTFFGFLKQTPPADRKRNKLLQSIVGFMRREEKRDLLRAGGTRGGQGILLGIAMFAAALLGAALRRFLLPFELTFKALKIGVAFKRIKDFFLSFKFLADRIFKIKWTFIKWGRKIADIFGKAGPLAKFGGVLSKLGMAFKFGFKFLGWPLAILLAVIDFIKGFIQTEGNIADKVMGGLKAAIMGFLELPIKLVGWLIEKVLGLFGVEVEGVADKIIGFVTGLVDFIHGWLRPIIGFFEGFFTAEGSFIDRIKAGFAGLFEGLAKWLEPVLKAWEAMEPLRKGVVNFFQAMGEWFGAIIDKFKPLLKWFGIEFGETTAETPKTAPSPKSSISTVTEAEAKKKAEEQKSQTKEITDKLEETTKAKIEADKKLKEEGDAATAFAFGGPGAPGGGEGSEKQIPDEVEGYWNMLGNQNLF